ncbi:SPFH domain-containing protein [uncultured Bifidobacterium sp.]|uniref:SPFH domain-containing protein n=1 Tax=uncultured Bifidobacterium sp. TaxID=165187 RepID=UPI00265EB133|nr:SPFH domain-containing protein [uncultured Bifidobacterium sp.]
MGILQAIGGAVGGAFGDQWKDIITAGHFDEHTALIPGERRNTDNGRGSNGHGSEGVITNGSKIYVPENTAAFIFSQSGIENIISQPGGYEYHDGQDSVFNGDGIGNSIFKQIGERIGYGGITSDYKQIAFVNLREIRDIKFGTRGPLMYNDLFYGTDLEIFAYGSFTIQIGDPVRFIRNFVPANVTHYSFDDQRARSQILAEFLQSFTVALNALSTQYRISQLPAQANDIAIKVANDGQNAGTWPARFGFNIVKIGIENIEFSDASRELVQKFSANKMDLKAYEDVSQHASNVAAQQKIAHGVEEHGFGDAGAMMFGAAFAQGVNPVTGAQANAVVAEQPMAAQQSASTVAVPSMSVGEQLDAVKKLKELLDAGILTQDEFDSKKKQILGL